MRILDYFSAMPKILLTLIGTLLVIVIGLLDYLTGYEISFSIFYLLPVLFAAWFAGRWPGMILSFLSVSSQLFADLTAGYGFSHPLIPIWNSVVRLSFFLLSAYFVSVIGKLLQREKELARRDPVTGIANYRSFTEHTQKEIKRAMRFKRPLSLAYMDIDNFKQINDRYGHTTGDSLLLVLAQAIQKNIRSMDLTARVGGDEFAVLMPETRSEKAKAAISKVQKIASDTMERHGWPVTLSIGVATCNNPSCSVDDLIRMADNLMYSAKNSGKNSVKYVII